MPTLETGVPLGNVAEILYAAEILGPSAWRNLQTMETDVALPDEPTLRNDLVDLFEMLHARSVKYLLVGGVAMLTYIDGRNTKDVDLVISVDSLELLPEIQVSERSSDFARGQFRNLRVDILFSSNPVFQLATDGYSTVHRFLETDVRCATAEGLILLKLYALPALYRQGDGQRIGLYENDIFMLIERHRPNIAPMYAALEPYVDADAMSELKNIVGDIQRRIDRIDRRKRP